MLNAYSSNFKKFLNKSQLFFSLSVCSLFKGFFDRSAVKEALSFYIFDEINLSDGSAAIPPEPPISCVLNIPVVAMPSKLAGIVTEV